MGRLTNLVFFATNGDLDIRIPKTLRSRDLPEMSPEWVMTHFQDWDVDSRIMNGTLASISTGDDDSEVLRENTLEQLCQPGQTLVGQEMWKQVQDDIPGQVWA